MYPFTVCLAPMGRRNSIRIFFPAAALIIFGAIVFGADPATNPAEDSVGVSVTKMPSLCTTRKFDAKHPDPRVPASSSERAGVCVSQFGCSASVAGNIVSQIGSDAQMRATVEIDSVKVSLQLNIVIWVANDSPPKVLAHEIGHRTISEHFYGDADTIAGSIAHDFLAKRYTATADNLADASRLACDAAARELVARYMAEVRDSAEVVQEAYDRITRHGTAPIDEMDAIKQAIAESEKSATK